MFRLSSEKEEIVGLLGRKDEKAVVVVVVCSVVVVGEVSLASSRDIPRSHLLGDAGEQRVTVESRLSSTKKGLNESAQRPQRSNQKK